MSTSRKARVVNRRGGKPYDINIARPTRWGNPYTHLKQGEDKGLILVPSREIAVEQYRTYIVHERHDLMAQLGQLVGKRLGCWCAPAACHGDVLVELVERWQAGEVCQFCGCSEQSACWDEEIGEPCAWYEPGLCSFCEDYLLQHPEKRKVK